MLLVYYSLQPVQGEKGSVEVLYAGSLLPLMETGVGPSFGSTGYGFKGEGHGSVQNANLVKDGQRFPDVFVSAGTVPLETLIQSNPPLASWYVTFAADEMAIAYNNKSRFANLFGEARQGVIPWYQVLASPNMKFLRSDPEIDPKDYYTVIVAKLADDFYHNSSISALVLRGERNTTQLRPEEVLVTLLQTGEVDAIPVYRHEAVERGLAYLTLPPEINLGRQEFADAYKQASYTLQNGRVVYGAPIVFVVTIPKTAKNIAGAVDFVKFLLSDNGERILRDHGFVVLTPTAGGNISDIPAEIYQLTNSSK